MARNKQNEKIEHFSNELVNIAYLLTKAKSVVAEEVINESVAWIGELLRQTMEANENVLMQYPATYQAVKTIFANIPDSLKAFLYSKRDKVEKLVLDSFIGTILTNADEDRWADEEKEAVHAVAHGMAHLLSTGLSVVYNQLAANCGLERALAKDLEGPSGRKMWQMGSLTSRYGTLVDDVFDQLHDSRVGVALLSVIDRFM